VRCFASQNQACWHRCIKNVLTQSIIAVLATSALPYLGLPHCIHAAALGMYWCNRWLLC
jgi:hypothetical protein